MRANTPEAHDPWSPAVYNLHWLAASLRRAADPLGTVPIFALAKMGLSPSVASTLFLGQPMET